MTEQIASSSSGDRPDVEGGSSRMLFVADVVGMTSRDRTTVFRWFQNLERLHGAEVIGRMRNRMFTTEAAWMRVAPRLCGPDADLKRKVRSVPQLWETSHGHARQLAQLTTQVRARDAQVGRLTFEVAELRGMIHALRLAVGVAPEALNSATRK